MEIPLNAQVECTDGVCGRSVSILVNPVIEEVTHLVVKDESAPNNEYIVPVNSIKEMIADTIRLSCTKAEFEAMDPFVKTAYIEERMPDRFYSYNGGSYGSGAYSYLPYVTPDTAQIPVDTEQIPNGEVSVRRGTRVEASDGYIGRVDELVVDPKNCHITHLVMREGHLWGQRDVIIPLSAMGNTRSDTVFLKLNKQEIEALPTFPLHRHWA